MKSKRLVSLLCATALVMTSVSGCGKNSVESSPSNQVSESETVQETSEGETVMEIVEDGIAQAIAMEHDSMKEQDEADAKLAEEGVEVTDEKAEITLAMPNKYSLPYEAKRGTVEAITYTAKDYIGKGEGCEKKAFVYLPADYDESKQYNVVYLMHGIGGNENEWGLNADNSKLKKILDRLMGEGSVEPFILVTPNGKALACEHKEDIDSFYLFGNELRNDLIPYIESHYSTYAEYDENCYDLSATRTHRAMAGLSMGGMQTINIGIGECMDLFSYFGAFSAAPTSNPKDKVAMDINNSEYTVDYFYNICGLDDNIAYQSSSTAAKSLPAICDKLVDEENYMWQEKPGGHDFGIWYLGMYNFAQLVFTK